MCSEVSLTSTWTRVTRNPPRERAPTTNHAVWEEYQLPSGELSNAYDLHIAAAAALKPLVELEEQAANYFAEQDQKQA